MQILDSLYHTVIQLSNYQIKDELFSNKTNIQDRIMLSSHFNKSKSYSLCVGMISLSIKFYPSYMFMS